VLENVLIPTLVSRDDPRMVAAWAKELLDRVGLGRRLDHRPAELSGGERQRVAVARALIHRPVLLLADEPTGNLDRRTAAAVGQLLLDLHRQEETILVVVTHSAELARLFPRVMEMGDGALQPVEVASSTAVQAGPGGAP
jgi:predicted ABC-type transport system involved in lysophospholipase L1 biosynthesis ATPase subunit